MQNYIICHIAFLFYKVNHNTKYTKAILFYMNSYLCACYSRSKEHNLGYIFRYHEDAVEIMLKQPESTIFK